MNIIKIYPLIYMYYIPDREKKNINNTLTKYSINCRLGMDFKNLLYDNIA